jgi:hypothetical protein
MAAPANPITVADLTAALKVALQPVLQLLGKIDGRLDKIEGRLDKIEGRLDKIEVSVARLEVSVARLEVSVASLEVSVARLDAARANEDVRRHNSVRLVGAPLAPLPFTYEGLPWHADVEQPARMLDLAVSGAEQLPGGG